jgi:hypothetical protein
MKAKVVIEMGRGGCGPGKIRRKAYTRKDGTHVRSGCIIDRGKPGKGPDTLPKPKKGHLKGWHADESAAKRRRALKKWTKRTNCRKTIGKLTLLRNLSDDPQVDRAAKADAQWLHDQGFCKLESKNGR